jgi:SAM-dependent methyltransferase
MTTVELMRFVRRLYDKVRGSASAEYAVIGDANVPGEGWRDSDIALRQHRAYEPVLEQFRRGHSRRDLQVAADAVAASGIRNPTVVEIGCGSGYYSEVLQKLAGPLHYVGLDHSAAMIALARASYPSVPFLVGDGTALPFAPAAVDVALSGTSLMHIADYPAAIAETARIARRWCVFHSVPVADSRPTTRLSKLAYGVNVYEAVFHRGELESLFAQNGLRIESATESLAYDLRHVIGEPTRLLTYACAKVG